MRQKGCLIAWASRLSDEDENSCQRANIPLLRMEDGFLRSVGLGAGLAPACALALDRRGIYYDARRPSDLEWMLEHMALDENQRQRGAKLRRLVIETRLSKYNLGGREKTFTLPDGREKILVPGQVADDASILKTHSNTVNLARTSNINLELLKTVRRNNPDAFVIYKPHPDVASGLRKGRLSQRQMRQYADLVVGGGDIISLIEQCGRVETISSLTGFEALLRGKRVVVHGQPFYAGWGLTEDYSPVARRRRKRSLDELVYIVLVEYCHHFDPRSMRPCSPEELMAALAGLRRSAARRLVNAVRLRLAWLGEQLRLYR